MQDAFFATLSGVSEKSIDLTRKIACQSKHVLGSKILWLGAWRARRGLYESLLDCGDPDQASKRPGAALHLAFEAEKSQGRLAARRRGR
ncbi:hypothetical protein [Tritonibacter sp. SIMBA_163]|uniref:hypothetical protein n=1 Tax=Tritonibacter sp. SIMBA_163 TaxID=3080868 RepID=UPI0039818790